ncbi:MAG: hypothetical protein CMN78_00385 [Spirochaetales bacterium]|nr:hypothetical protein [Spirochaetales bacterium]
MQTRNYLILGIIIILTVTLSGCLSRPYAEMEGTAAIEMREESAPETATRTRASTTQPGGAVASLSSVGGEAADGTAVSEEKSAPRKRVYSGHAALTVDDIQDTKARLIVYVDSIGGYVEWVRERSVSMRVPVESFQESFEWVLGIGTVNRKSVETYDVTAYYADLESRMNIAVATRERLYQLLERTDDVKERLKILQEIRRLTEEIEGIKNTLTALDNRIAFSRIVVELESRVSDINLRHVDIPFSWIADLNPLSPSTGTLRGRVRLEAGDTFAVFSDEKYYRAENAVGVRLRVGTVGNTPRGDTDFWRSALLYHLSDFYRDTERVDFQIQNGVLQSAVFISKDREPYYYLVGVRAVGKWLYVIEVFYPSEDAYRSDHQTVIAALETLELP